MVKPASTFPPVCLHLLILLCCGGPVDACRGRSTRDTEYPGEYEIVVPRKVRSDGRFVSHQIPHHFKRSFYTGRKRTDTIPDDAVHYRLQIGDEEHHLELRPNPRLVAPGAVVEDHEGKFRCNEDFLSNMKLQRMRDAQCHYQGHVHGQSEKSALSTCCGLAGYIRTKRSWYTIEPMASHDFAKESEHPHIVYEKRWLPNELVETLCNVTDNKAKTVAKRAFSSRKRHSAERAKSYTLELLLVLDKSFLDYRRDFDVENYALTLLNMASGLLHDVSLGVLMELSVVRVIRMEVEGEEMNLSLNKDAEETLKSFQEWQRLINPGDDSHPNHHDLAILLAKSNICESSNLCGFTGTSTIAGACDPLKEAAVLKDVGLQTGYHIAHHIGHTLGMSHDVEEENGCPGVIHHGNGYTETMIMHPGSFYVTKRWSKCSRNSLKTYIESGLGSCLEDEPQDHDFPSSELLPGVMYDANDQCRLQYHRDAGQCDLPISCEALRCAIPGKGCVSARKPPAEGTSCGRSRGRRIYDTAENRSLCVLEDRKKRIYCEERVLLSRRLRTMQWCHGMKCLMVGERPGVLDGGWSGWSSWSRCSRTCGSGVASSVRRCSSPSPSGGGASCRGDRKRHKICASNPCEIDAPSFRDVQCGEFNNWIFPEDGKVHRWTAYRLPENLRATVDPCALYCLAETNLLASLRPKVVDGTTCYRGIRDICIAGVCREIPCDLNMESSAVEDVCGVCKGNGTSCRVNEGTVTLEASSQPRKIVNVPTGSTNVRVEVTEPSKSRIMVRSVDGKSLIDGDRLGMSDAAGAMAWLGTIRPSQEFLSVPGPVAEDLLILILAKENVTVKYSLALKEKSPRKAEFSWGFVDWDKCNANCGPGEQISKPRCLERVAGMVDATFCKNIPKPEEKVRPCHQAPCLPRWMIGDWQGCTSCVAGCERRRAVKCVRPVGHSEQDVDIIADSYCQGPKPKERESCTGTRKRRRDVATRDEKNSDDRRLYKKRTVEDHENSNHSDARNGEVVIDVENIKNLTLTIVLDRDEETGALNFPKDFEPQPPGNSTEFTLVGMDAVRYIQQIQEDSDVSSKRRQF